MLLLTLSNVSTISIKRLKNINHGLLLTLAMLLSLAEQPSFSDDNAILFSLVGMQCHSLIVLPFGVIFLQLGLVVNI